MRVVTVTMNPSVDKSAKLAHVMAERKLRCGGDAREPGGGGINVARAMRILGGEPVALYPAGGCAGGELAALLDREGVAHRRVSIDGRTRENLTVYEDATGLQYRFGMPGPTLSGPEWRACLDAVLSLDPAPEYVVASGSLPPGVPEDFYATLAREAGARGSKVVLDTSGPALRLALEAGVFLVKPNFREFGEMVGMPVCDEGDQEGAALDLVRSGHAVAVLVSLGAGGAVLVTAEGCTHLRAPAVQVKSKVGAGDSMVAGMVTGLSRGWAMREAAMLGVAAGAAAVMTDGSELCRREDAERLYELIRAAGSAPSS